MARVFLPSGRTIYRARLRRGPGDWFDVSTSETDPVRAEEYRKSAQAEIDAKLSPASAALTFRVYVSRWIEKRKESGHDWKRDLGKLKKHALEMLGEVPLADIKRAQIVALVHDLRFKAKKAQRTVRNVYSVIAAVFRDALNDELIAVSPCTLDDTQLGPIEDKDPTWRSGAVYTHAEAEAMIADPRIPLDRQIVYAFGVLAGFRPCESAALRWGDYDDTCEPLGKITAALSFNTDYQRLKRTKTGAVRYIPVHRVLASMLLEWRTSGWARMMGREPTFNDLIIPLPPDYKRRTRTGEPFRPTYYTNKRWRTLDQPALGWRARKMYDMRATFITLVVGDGADRSIIRDRVTHTKPRRDAFDGYDRGVDWVATCREVEKLRLFRRATALLPQSTGANDYSDPVAPEEGIEPPIIAPNAASDHPKQPGLRTECDRSVHLMVATVASLATAEIEDLDE